MLEAWQSYTRETDSILANDAANEITLGIPVLSPIIPILSPVKPFKERFILAQKIYKGMHTNKFSSTIRFASGFIGLLRFFFKTSLSLRSHLRRVNMIPRKIDIILVTHLINEKQLKSNFDPYYGTLAEELRDNGYKVLIVLIPHFRFKQGLVERASNRSEIPHIVLPSFGSLSQHKVIFKKSILESLRLRRLAKNSFKERKSILYLAAEEVLSVGSLWNQYLSIQIKELVKRLQVKALITTFEGHAWERSIYSAVHQLEKPCRCYAYQHTLIFRSQHSISRKLRKGWNPDVIMTSGDFTANILKQRYQESIPVYNLGSPKYIKTHPIINKNRMGIIFVPSGDLSETLDMATFAIELAPLMPEVKLKLRLHPRLSKQRIVKAIKALNKPPGNFGWSEGNMQTDANQSLVAVYSHSTAIFEAVKYGCWPFRLNLSSYSYIYDPLWAIDDNKKNIITTKEQMKSKYRELISNHYKAEYKSNLQYIQLRIDELRSKFDSGRLLNELKEISLTSKI